MFCKCLCSLLSFENNSNGSTRTKLSYLCVINTSYAARQICSVLEPCRMTYTPARTIIVDVPLGCKDDRLIDWVWLHRVLITMLCTPTMQNGMYTCSNHHSWCTTRLQGWLIDWLIGFGYRYALYSNQYWAQVISKATSDDSQR